MGVAFDHPLLLVLLPLLVAWVVILHLLSRRRMGAGRPGRPPRRAVGRGRLGGRVSPRSPPGAGPLGGLAGGRAP